MYINNGCMLAAQLIHQRHLQVSAVCTSSNAWAVCRAQTYNCVPPYSWDVICSMQGRTTASNLLVDHAERYIGMFSLLLPSHQIQYVFVHVCMHPQVVCAVGASEASLDPSGPKKVDGEGSIRLIEAAKSAGVSNFILVSSLGTGKIGWPAGILNLFGGVLIFKRRAEEALERSGMSYTIVRPGRIVCL